METKQVLFNRRGAPTGASTRSVGRALRSCLMALLMLFVVQGAWGLTIHGSGPYYTDWLHYTRDGETGITFFVRGYERGQCEEVKNGQFNNEMSMKMTNREVTPAKPYIEIEIPLISATNDCYTTINLLHKKNNSTETIPTLYCYQQTDGSTNYSGNHANWITEHTEYGVWRHTGMQTRNGVTMAVLRFYPTKQYYAKGICCIEVLQKWDWGGDGGASNMKDYKYKIPSLNYERSIDYVYTYHLYPTFSDTTYEPTVERKAPQQVTFTVKPGAGKSNGKYVYNIDLDNDSTDVEVTSGTSSYDLDGEYDDGFTYEWLAYSLENIQFPSPDLSNHATPSVEACVFAGGPAVNTGADTNIGWTYKSVTVGASSDVKRISAIIFDKWAKTVKIEWEKNDGTQTNGHWGIYRTLNGVRKYLGKVNYDVLTYTDKDPDLEYDKTYTYEVSYLPGSGTNYTYDQLCKLNKQKDIDLTRSFEFGEMTLEEKEINNKTNIVYTWNHEAIPNASSTKPCTLYVQRSEDDGNTWTNLGNAISITSSETVSGSYNDANVVTHQPYLYRVTINVQDKDFTSPSQLYTISNGSKLTGFQASRGTYNNVVKLSWTVNQVGSTPTYFTLQRRPLGTDGDTGWATIYTTTGTASDYSYDDNTSQPGSFNEYRLKIYDEYGGKRYEGTSLTTDGFSIATGVISGRITYGSGTAVEGARVTLNPNNADGKDIQSNKALYMSGESGSGLVCNTTNEEIKKIFGNGKAFTVQMWMRPQTMDTGKEHTLLDVRRTFGLRVNYKDGGYWLECMIEDNQQFGLDFALTEDVWQQVSVVYDNGKVKAYSTTDGTTFQESSELLQSINEDNLNNAVSIGIGNWQNLGSSTPYHGYLDELRIFSRALTFDEIKQNYNHTMNGSEENLQVYYPFDEGLKSQKVAYDFSRQNGVANGHHATTKIALVGQGDVVPSEDQLSLMTYTDKNGNYLLRGVPFSGDGTNYNVIPSKGVHEFSPSKQSRYVSANSLNFSAVDFSDISSFRVSGKVLYDGTDIPVDSVQFFVDGNICARESKPIMTDESGDFTIDVPIGDHYITAKRQSHTFVYEGRYPADENHVGLKHTFVEEEDGHMFYDNTMVVLAGRVVGGPRERDKQLGFGLSKNNIGKARITLQTTDEKYHLNVPTTKDGTVTDKDYGKTTVALQSPTEKVNSTAYRNANSNGDPIPASQIIIETDSLTGEYAVLLPPLRYKVVSVKYIKNNINVAGSTNDEVNLTRIGLEKTDTLKGDKSQTFTYLTRYDKIYNAPTTFNVTQEGRTDSYFGLNSVTFKDGANVEHTVPLWEPYDPASGKEGGQYMHGAPVFQQGEKYTFNIEAYQRYVNKDTQEEDMVPMDSMEVIASNGLSDEQYVAIHDSAYYNGKSYKAGDLVEMQTNKFYLDHNGKASYVWTAGFPDLTPPYNHKGFNFAYNKNEQWKSARQDAIILGCVPTGSNFATAAPDVVDMVLRDPPGTGSSATWLEGSTTTTSHSDYMKVVTDDKMYIHSQIGAWNMLSEGVGVMHVEKIEGRLDSDVGVHSQSEKGDEYTTVTTTTLEKSISTSSEPEYVGADGDIFIGRAKNYTFGGAQILGFQVTENGGYELYSYDGLTRGVEYDTHFQYTQFYVENTLLPNLEKHRNALLIYNANPESVEPVKGKIIFVTSLKPGDYGYGSSNNDSIVWGDRTAALDALTGPSYAMIVPRNAEGKPTVAGCDSIKYYNNNIMGWKSTLAANEEAKVMAKENRSEYLDQNLSFDSGSSVTMSSTQTEAKGTTTTEEFTTTAILNTDLGFYVNEVGASFKTENEWGRHKGNSDGKEEETHTTVSYTLAEVGDDDAISVDVYNSPDGFSPIFITKGGQTSCPYEGARYTKYYEPTTKLDEATMQIEQPHIFIDGAKDAVKGGVANGTKARFDVVLTNTSETKEDLYFEIIVPAKSNPKGAKVALNTKNISMSKVSVLVPAKEEVKAVLTIEQDDISVQDYDSIAVVIASQCQQDPASTWEVITDTAYVSVHFIPSSSPVTMKIAATTVNTNSEEEAVEIRVDDYDLDFNGFKNLKLQYKYANDADWTTFKEYYASNTYATPTSEQLPEGGLTYNYDMKGMSDGQYTFRAMSTSVYGSQEFSVYSDEIAVIKDMHRPQLLGLANPSDGILSAGEEISVNFNEDIRSGAINEMTSFKIIGELNEAQIDHNVGLKMEGSDRGTAYTEADITLGNRSFSVESWVNITGAGTLFAHGKGSNTFTLGADAEGHLVVTIGEQSYTSVKAMPLNKWAYLMVSYKYDEGASTLTANIASDAETINLFAATKVADYNGSGAIKLGQFMTGAIHELTIWDGAHTLGDAQQYMHISKKPTEPGLIGYWKFDEGNGTTATDVARSRNMTLTTPNCWYLNNVNKAVTLNGSSALHMDITAISSGENDDYALEMWFKGGDTNKGATLFTTSEIGELKLGFDADGMMTLTSKGDATQLSKNNYLDNAWHHVALNVLRNGTATVYVDGTAAKQLSAKSVAALQGYALYIGADTLQTGSLGNYFTGSIDEVRLWHATLNGKTIQNRIYNRLQGDEEGLVAYYPFEAKTLDSGNQVITVTSALDNALDANGKPSVLNMTATAGELTYCDEAPALKPAKTATNLDFSYVASERKIVLTLNNTPDLLEGTTVEFTVKNVTDVNGNNCEPIVWTAYIRQNQLLWLDDMASVQGEQGSDISFTAQFENTSGQNATWALSGMPSWLNASELAGTVAATKQKTLTFTVDPSTAIGKYETIIYLYGDNQIYEPFTVKLNVTGELPDWKVDPSVSEYSMNIVGVLSIDGKYSDDSDDMVAAFNGTKCVGVAKPQYFAAYDSYRLLMTVYGKETAELNYKAYDASTGIIYPSVNINNNNAFTFVQDAVLGDFDTPVVFSPTNEIEQDLSYNNVGWKWFSLYAQPKDNHASKVFKNSQSSINVVTGGSSENTLINWFGTDFGFEFDKMYKLEAIEPYTESLIGERVDFANTDITLNGNGWTWIGYPCPATNSLDAAFADAEPLEGDIVKNQTAFSMYTNGEWFGNLNMMTPGDGYMYKSTAASEKVFQYATPAAGGKANAPRRSQGIAQQLQFKDNMTMVAVVMNGDEMVENARISAYAGTELRGFSGEAIACNESGRHFLTVGGQNGEMITYVVVTESGEEYYLSQADIFAADSHRGTIEDPFVLQMNETTSIDLATAGRDIKVVELYDGAGRMVERKVQPGRVYTADDLRTMPAGIYFQKEVFASGECFVKKLTK